MQNDCKANWSTLLRTRISESKETNPSQSFLRSSIFLIEEYKKRLTICYIDLNRKEKPWCIQYSSRIVQKVRRTAISSDTPYVHNCIYSASNQSVNTRIHIPFVRHYTILKITRRHVIILRAVASLEKSLKETIHIKWENICMSLSIIKCITHTHRKTHTVAR